MKIELITPSNGQHYLRFNDDITDERVATPAEVFMCREIDALKAALEFYANRFNWAYEKQSAGGRVIDRDNGLRARQALKPIAPAPDVGGKT